MASISPKGPPAGEISATPLLWFRTLLSRMSRRRRLKPTRSGTLLIAMSLAVGFAAINTGNNLLFFGWGLLLSAILVSGILSESTLRGLSTQVRSVSALRAGERGTVTAIFTNKKSYASFAVTTWAHFTLANNKSTTGQFSALRIAAHGEEDGPLQVVPASRGVLSIHELVLHTAFPFGFFEKEKRVHLRRPISFPVWPARVPLDERSVAALARGGETPIEAVGNGEDVFGLREFRTGDDPKRIVWRRSARTGRTVIKEMQATTHQDVIIDVRVKGAEAKDAERAFSLAATLMEAMVEDGQSVGLRVGKAQLACATGARHLGLMLDALAFASLNEETESTSGRARIIGIVASGASSPTDADTVLVVRA